MGHLYSTRTTLWNRGDDTNAKRPTMVKTTQRTIERSMLVVSPSDHIRNNEIRWRTKITGIAEKIFKTKMEFDRIHLEKTRGRMGK